MITLYSSTPLAFKLCLVLLLLMASTPSYAQTLSQDEITASYLYNFIKNITWPNTRELSTLSIAVYQPVDLELPAQLSKHFTGTKLHGLPINVKAVLDPSSLSSFQVVLIEEGNAYLLESLYNNIDGSPTLLVSHGQSDKQLVMINLFTTKDSRIKFEVNKANILNHGLRVNPNIILNGGSEIDVAKLFREGQASLITMQQQMRAREKMLQSLENGINDLQEENVNLNRNLLSLEKHIAESKATIKKQKELIENQESTLNTHNVERQRLEYEVQQKNQQLNDSQDLLDEIGNKISSRENQLKDLNNTLLLQKSRIVEMDDTINTQSIIVNNLIALVVLGIILVIVTVWAYVSKRKDAQRLEARGKELKIARDKLAISKVKAEEANQAKSEFLSLMSHELRTPLQAVIGYTDVVIEELKLDGLDSYTQDLDRVVNNSERLLRLINGVLDLAKIESGHMDLHLVPVDLRALVSDAVANVRPQYDEKKLRLSIQVDNGKELPVADHEKLLHIVLNLLSNAGKFTESGVVEIIAAHREHNIFISVQDSGAGIDPAQLPYVFERFQQVDSSATRRHQGSGLGLTITKQFCELMGGTIDVRSELNKGTTFTLSIPLPIYPPSHNRVDTQAKMIDEDLGADNSLSESPIRLLMIDDDIEFLNIMARTLRKADYKVYTATSADKGLKLAKELIPDLITIDLLLPDMHGWELFSDIKNSPDLSEIPIIIVSVIDDRKRSKKLGADDFLTKPVARTALKIAVEKLTNTETVTSERLTKPT